MEQATPVSPNQTPMDVASDTLSGATPTISNAANAASAVAPSLTPAAPTPTPPTPEQHHRSLMGDILHAIGEVLGGPSTRDQVNPQTGAIERVPLSRTQRIANTAGIYLRGAAAGAAQHGPGAVGKAALAGVNEQQDFQQRQFQNTQEESRNVQSQLAGKASRALQAQQIAESGWRMAREGTELDQATAANMNNMQDMISRDPRNKDLGQFASFADLTTAHPELLKAGVNLPQLMAQGQIRAVVTTANGKPTGIHVYEVSPDWAQQKNDKDVIIKVPDGTDAKGNPKYKDQKILAGSMGNGDLLSLQTSLGQKQMENTEKAKQLQIEGEKAKAEEAEHYGAAQRDVAEAKAMNIDELKTPDLTGATITPPPGGIKEYNKRADEFTRSKEYTNLQSARAAKQQFDEISSDMEKGNFSGAESITALFDAIGISATPLQGKGLRINQSVIAEHMQARGLDQAIYQKLLKLKAGDVITPKQLKDYAGIADGVVYNSYVNAIDDAHNQGLKADFLLPTGHNQPIDPLTMKVFFTAANNNPQQAAAAAKAKGWLPPQQ